MSSSKKNAITITSQHIAQDVENFLKNGGKIQRINSGISGQQFSPGPKSVLISKKAESK